LNNYFSLTFASSAGVNSLFTLITKAALLALISTIHRVILRNTSDVAIFLALLLGGDGQRYKTWLRNQQIGMYKIIATWISIAVRLVEVALVAENIANASKSPDNILRIGTAFRATSTNLA